MKCLSVSINRELRQSTASLCTQAPGDWGVAGPTPYLLFTCLDGGHLHKQL